MFNRDLIIKAVDDLISGDPVMLDMLVTLLTEHSEAKKILRNKGYGWTGMNLVLTAREAPDADALQLAGPQGRKERCEETS